MPVMDGLSATNEIRSLPSPLCDVPIYALTADVLTCTSWSLSEMALDGYLTKPIDWQTLSAAIMRVVRAKEQKRLGAGDGDESEGKGRVSEKVGEKESDKGSNL